MSQSEFEQQSLVEHLNDLRTCLIRSLVAILIGFVGIWLFGIETVMTWVAAPIKPFLNATSGQLIFTSPIESFANHLKLGFLTSIIVTSPFWLYQIWAFLVPALYPNEKVYARYFVIVSCMLFLAGVSFVYWGVLPLAFEFLLQFGGDQNVAMISLKEYLDFFLTVTLVFGIVFQLPVVMGALALAGILDAAFLVEYRRYAIVILAAISAILTPPDVLSMILMLIPLIALYECSILVVRMIGKRLNS